MRKRNGSSGVFEPVRFCCAEAASARVSEPARATVNLATSCGLLPVGVFVLPVLVGGCLPDGRNGVPWYEARRDPTGLAPQTGTTPEAVIQVYAARGP